MRRTVDSSHAGDRAADGRPRSAAGAGVRTTMPTDHEFWKYNMTEGMPGTYYQVPPYGSGGSARTSATSTSIRVRRIRCTRPCDAGRRIHLAERPDSAAGMRATEVMPKSAPQNQTPPNGQQFNGQPPQSASPQMTGPRMGPPPGPAQPAGAIRPAGWSAPRPPAASPQAMMPMNQTAPSQGNPGSAWRNRRDQQQSSRY